MGGMRYAKPDIDIVKNELTSLSGMSDVEVFIDNKTVNDYFFKVTYNGVRGICKFSSKAFASIRNEYLLTDLLNSKYPKYFPRPLLFHKFTSVDGSAVVLEYLPGRSLRALVDDGDVSSYDQAVSVVNDLSKIVNALINERIIHRDFHAGNLIQGEDGRLRLIDLQFSVKKDINGRYREDPFLLKWFWTFVPVFGCFTGVGVGRWNDIHAVRMVLKDMPQYDVVKDFDGYLAKKEMSSTLYIKPSFWIFILFPFNKFVCYVRLIYHTFYKPKKKRKFKERLELIKSAKIGWKRN